MKKRIASMLAAMVMLLSVIALPASAQTDWLGNSDLTTAKVREIADADTLTESQIAEINNHYSEYEIMQGISKTLIEDYAARINPDNPPHCAVCAGFDDLYQLVVKSKALRKPLSRSYFNQVGKDVPLYNGVDTWFERVNQYGEENGIEVHHYIISSGLKEIIEGSNIARYFSRVYASSYLYSADGVAEWPAQAVNYTNKTQFIFRIAKGIFEEYDERVNDSVPESALVTPYENIVYIGDSATDIPCMRLVKSKGGYSIGVFDPEKNKREKVYQLFNDGRINFYAPADYSEDSELFKYIKLVIGQISINERVKTEQRTLKNSAEAYNLYITMQSLADHMKSAVSPREYQKLQRELNKLQHQIEGI